MKILKKTYAFDKKINHEKITLNIFNETDDLFKVGVVYGGKTNDVFLVFKVEPCGYLTKDDLCSINYKAQKLFEEIGIYGVEGVRDENLLSSLPISLETSYFGTEQYGTILKKAAWLWYSLTKNHCFLNGNKRTGLLATNYFLKLNGYSIIANRDELYEFTRKIASSQSMNKDIILLDIEQFIFEKLILDVSITRKYIQVDKEE